MPDEILSLADVLERIHEIPWSLAIYLPIDEDWNLQTRCAVLDPDDCEDDDDDPAFAMKNDLSYALGVAQAQDIAKNAEQQRPNLELSGLLEAFLFYYDNDAFVEF